MKKLTRCESNRIICGVCSGIARYLDMDPTAVRLVWSLITVFTGGVLGIIAYIAAALIIPSDNQV